MRAVYAVQFNLHSATGDDLSRVQEKASEWVTGWYGRSGITCTDIPTAGGELQPLSGHSIKVQSTQSQRGGRLWTLRWSYPSDLDPTVLWTSEFIAAAHNDVAEVALLVHLESTTFRIAPLRFTLRRPRLVRTLLETITCTSGGTALAATPQAVGIAAIDAFVRDVLLSPNRALPVITFSRESDDART